MRTRNEDNVLAAERDPSSAAALAYQARERSGI
jgi:hypothetical protein